MSHPTLVDDDSYYTAVTELHLAVSAEQKVRLATMVRLYLDEAPNAEKKMVNFCLSLCREHALHSIAGKIRYVTTTQAVKAVEDAKSAAIAQALQAPIDMCTALAMGQHARLGGASPVRHLDLELLRLVMARAGLRECSYLA